jgi:hypothetical protein
MMWSTYPNSSGLIEQFHRKVLEMTMDITRRDFSSYTLGSLLTYALLERICTSDALARDVQPIAANWLAHVNQLSADLRGQKLSQVQWQSEIETLFGQVELTEFLTYVDFDKLTQNLEFRDRGERAFHAQFPAVEGLPTDLVFGHQMFALHRGRSVAPHGHYNMATAFLILKGAFQGKHYDRIEDDDAYMVIKPTINRPFQIGEYSTVSDFKDNVHWFQATQDNSFIFNIHVMNLDPQIKKGGRVYIDPNGEKLAGDRIRARKLKAAEALALYG